MEGILPIPPCAFPNILVALLLPINILEAVLRDVQLGNLINVVSGIIVIGLLPTPDRLKISSQKNNPRQISYPTSWFFIIAYTLWHLCFMYGYPSGRGFTGDYALLNIATLLIPILAAWTRHPQYWFQARAYTLTFNVLMIEATVVNHPEFWPLTPNVYNSTVYSVFSLLVFVVILSGWFYMARYRREAYDQTIFGTLFRAKTAEQPADVGIR